MSRISDLKKTIKIDSGNKELLADQVANLSQQMPLLYLILSTSGVCIGYVMYSTAPVYLTVAVPLILILYSVLRFRHWKTVRNTIRTYDENLLELRKVVKISVAIAILFSVWLVTLLNYADLLQKSYLFYFFVLAIVGCVFCLYQLPPAVWVVILFGVPVFIVGTILFGDGLNFPALIAALAVDAVAFLLLIAQYFKIHSDLITSRKESREHRERIREERDKAQAANDSKTEFLANMSHELRTPLNAIIGFSEVINKEMIGPLEGNKVVYTEYAADINSSAQHLLRLINDMLDVSAIEAGKKELFKEEVNIEEMLSDLSVMAQSLADVKGTKIDTYVDKKLPVLFVDRRAITQVLINIVGNAIKFSPKGSAVKVSVSNAQVSDAETVTFEIKDNGPGIPKDKLGNVFEKFERVQSSSASNTEGTGLGLYISREIIEMHGGRITVDSDVGRGACFRVDIPVKLS